jgi:hypothetical protein
MDFDFKRLTACNEPFFGIVPSKAAYPMGRVSLLVTFGTEENFRMEYLNFKVADCDNPPRQIPYYRLRPIRFGH